MLINRSIAMTETVYKITTNVDDSVYIGSTKNTWKRLLKHQSSLRNGRHTSSRFQQLYDANADTVTLTMEEIETFEDPVAARRLEERLLNETPNLLNSSNKATGGDMVSNHPRNTELREIHRSNAKKLLHFTQPNTGTGVSNPNYRHGKSTKGRKCPSCGGSIGFYSSQCSSCYDKHGENNPFYGRTHSVETKKLLSERFKGIPNVKAAKKISVDGIIYPSNSEASKKLGIPTATLSWRANNPNIPNVFYINDE